MHASCAHLLIQHALSQTIWNDGTDDKAVVLALAGEHALSISLEQLLPQVLHQCARTGQTLIQIRDHGRPMREGKGGASRRESVLALQESRRGGHSVVSVIDATSIRTVNNGMRDMEEVVHGVDPIREKLTRNDGKGLVRAVFEMDVLLALPKRCRQFILHQMPLLYNLLILASVLVHKRMCVIRRRRDWRGSTKPSQLRLEIILRFVLMKLRQGRHHGQRRSRRSRGLDVGGNTQSEGMKAVVYARLAVLWLHVYLQRLHLGQNISLWRAYDFNRAAIGSICQRARGDGRDGRRGLTAEA